MPHRGKMRLSLWWMGCKLDFKWLLFLLYATVICLAAAVACFILVQVIHYVQALAQSWLQP